MTIQRVYIVRATDSEGNVTMEAFNNEEKAIQKYDTWVKESHEEFKTRRNGEYGFEEFEGAHIAMFDTDEYSERIEIDSLTVN